MNIFLTREVARIVDAALREDIGSGDITSRAFIASSVRGRASVVFKEPGVVCGLPLMRLVFRRLSGTILFHSMAREGASVSAGAVIARISGPLRSILAGERTALNFLQRLSGIAAMTRVYVRRVGKRRALIMDTRKTTPSLRLLEKYAVRIGGGRNHRFGLSDAILVKSNHLASLSPEAIARSVRRARSLVARGGFVEMEARNLREALRFAALDIDILMLDNFSVPALRAAVRRIRAVRPGLLLEASGGITLSNVGAVAATGVDRISVGALTHSVRAADIALRVERD